MKSQKIAAGCALPRAGRPASAVVLPASQREKAGAMVGPLLDWFHCHARDLPWRRTTNPYAVWVSEIMLQQTQVKTVIPYFERWMSVLPNVEALAKVAPDRIHKLWEGLGYYRRVRNMQRAAQQIVAAHGGEFPSGFEDVLALPGIGRYTAGAICSIAFNQPTAILDGNVVRVLARVFGIRESTKEKNVIARLWALAASMVACAANVPTASRSKGKRASAVRRCSALNQALMELGATVCTPQAPRCDACPVSSRCTARRQGWTGQLPNLGDRVTFTARRFAAAVVQRDDRVLVRQRPGHVVNGHLWEFPNVELVPDLPSSQVRKALENELCCAIEKLTALATVKHSITRYRITLDAFRAHLAPHTVPSTAGEWKTIREIDALAFTSAHRKIARSVLG